MTSYFVFRLNDASTLITLYKAYVISILEYGSQARNPYTKSEQAKIEKVQQTFTRISMNRCIPSYRYPQSMPGYSERPKFFKLRTSPYRRVFDDIVFCFEVLEGEGRLKASKY
ncbi:hypothetical protein Y032_0001g24 [Ancylostoma ceylanicum]|uniref:Uncharacterized protein n=1 Tax=Ancylostoma ceylanicum TaxID=53326 RepID=A0A016W4A0_9BILA|nr:hypothetical protein Y032_0001g24 [Ancylostoma ceylanicum]